MENIKTTYKSYLAYSVEELDRILNNDEGWIVWASPTLSIKNDATIFFGVMYKSEIID